MATNNENTGHDLSRLILGTFLLLSAGVFLSEILDFIETGTWTTMSVMAFVDLLTEEGEVAGARSALLGLRFVLSLVPVLPVFLMSCLIALVWNPIGDYRRSPRDVE